jgi:hypothetical protein
VSAPQPAPRAQSQSRGGDPVPPASARKAAEPHPLDALHEAFGNLGVVRRLADPAVQARLEIGSPDDEYEREADAVAARALGRPDPLAPSVHRVESRVSRRAEDDDKKKPAAPQRAAGAAAKAPEPAPTPKAPPPKPAEAPKSASPKGPAPGPAPKTVAVPTPAPAPKSPAPPAQAAKTPAPVPVQHPEKAKPDAPPPPPHAGGTTTMHPDRKRDEPTVAAKAEPGAVPSVTPRAARTITSQEGAGQPLSPGDRSFFESRLGHDLGSVRIHDDSSARAAARDVQAQAFTYGQDVYFAAGRYQPGTASGRELLAHELAHTIQQRPGAPIARRIQRVPVGNPAIGTVDGDLLTLPSVQVPSFKLGRYGQQLYTGNLDARPLQRNKGYFPNTRPDQRSDWKRVGTIDTTRSEAALTAAATLPHPAPPFNAGSQYSWRLPHGEVINATVPNAARRFTLPDWNRAGEAMDFDVDHLRELQLANWPGAGSAWANTKENWALLESRANSTSGSRLRTYISHATQAFMTNPAADALTARQAISGLNASPSASQVNAEASKLRRLVDVRFLRAVPEQQDVGLNEFWTVADIEAGTHLRNVHLATISAPPSARVEVFPLEDGGRPQLFNVSGGAVAAGSGAAGLLAPLSIRSARFPGAAATAGDLGELTVYRQGGHLLAPLADDTIAVKRLGTAMRVGYADPVKLRQLLTSVQIEALSPITIDELESGPRGIRARGRVQTTIPVIRDADIRLAIDGNDITISKHFSANEIHLPPPFSIDDVSLTIFASTARGLGADGDIFFGIERVGSGQLHAELSTSAGLGFDGRFLFDTSVFTRAEVGVHYHHSIWSGDGVLEIGSGKVRGVRRAHLDASYSEGHLHAAGNAEFDIPGVQSADAVLDYDAEHGLTVTATTNLHNLSAIKDGTVTVTLAQRPGGSGYRVAAHGNANASIAGIDAQLAVDYDDGAFVAQAHVPLHIGLLNGQIDIGVTNTQVGEDGRLVPNAPAGAELIVFGGGSASIQITSWLRGDAGVHLLPNGELAVHGALTVPAVNLWEPITPDPIHIISPPPIHIPIFGPVVLELGGSLNAKYGLEAGVLSGSINLDYNPSHPDQTHLYGAIGLHSNAYAGLELDLFAGVGLDALVASVTGRVTLGAEARLDAPFGDDIHIDWTPTSGLSFTSTFTASLSPKLIFHIYASIVVSALFWDHEWKTELGRKEFGSGLQMSLSLPVHYDEGHPLAVDWGHVDFHHPDIDPLQTAKDFIKEVV